jgi:two-component system NarL family sensor kinase
MENNQETGVFIAIGCFVMLGLALGLITFLSIHKRKIVQKEREKEIDIFKAANEAEERERQKIAKDLHDGIVPVLGAVERSMDKNMSDYRLNRFDLARMRTDMQAIERTINDIRGISHNLVPNIVLSSGFIKALRQYMEMIRDTGETQADFENKTDSDHISLSVSDQLNIYRICLEILNNLFKHARYKYLKVTVEKEANLLSIDFTHDGIGITTEEVAKITESSSGLGLKSLRSRVLLLHANIDYMVEAEISSVNLRIPVET